MGARFRLWSRGCFRQQSLRHSQRIGGPRKGSLLVLMGPRNTESRSRMSNRRCRPGRSYAQRALVLTCPGDRREGRPTGMDEVDVRAKTTC